MRRTTRNWMVVFVLVAALAVTGADFAIAGAATTAKDQVSEKSGKPVDLNTATESELAQIPGIGKVLAKRIVEFRESQGPYRRVEDLMKVKGIGEKSFQKLRPHITVSKTG